MEFKTLYLTGVNCICLSVTELQTERSTTQKLESNRMMLERQNKDLKQKLNELETNVRTKSKTIITNLEAKLNNLEEQLEAEAK